MTAVIVFRTYVSIFLESSKTDQFRDGVWRLISRYQIKILGPSRRWSNTLLPQKNDLSEDLSLFCSFVVFKIHIQSSALRLELQQSPGDHQGRFEGHNRRFLLTLFFTLREPNV